MPVPAQRIDRVYTLSGLRSYLDEQRKLEGQQYDALHEGAAALKGALRAYVRSANGNGRGWLGAEQRIIIARIIKPFERAADHHMQSAKDLSLVWQNAQRLFVPQSSGTRSGVFDPQK